MQSDRLKILNPVVLDTSSYLEIEMGVVMWPTLQLSLPKMEVNESLQQKL